MNRQLQLFSATLDSWLLVQRGWLKLEAVFAAPDIQRQVPAEATAFAQVDKTFKDIMRRTHDRPNALQVGDLELVGLKQHQQHQQPHFVTSIPFCNIYALCTSFDSSNPYKWQDLLNCCMPAKHQSLCVVHDTAEWHNSGVARSIQ